MEFDMVVKKKMMMVAWVCGILASIVVLSSVLIAISRSPSFSWTANMLSDLGDSSKAASGNGAASIFNSGLIVGGILMMVFAAGRVVAGGKASNARGQRYFSSVPSPFPV